MKDLVIEPTEGPLKGEKLFTHKMTSFLPNHGYGGVFSFVCPFISFSGETSAFDQPFHIFPYHINSSDTDHVLFNLPMYVNKKIVKEDLIMDDSMQGVALLQGYLIESFDK